MSKRLNSRNTFRKTTVRDLRDYVEVAGRNDSGEFGGGDICGLLAPFAKEHDLDLIGIKELILKYDTVLCSCNYEYLVDNLGLDYELPRKKKWAKD